MKVFEDIWASIKGNAQTRINDPIIGAFICSWILCNWDNLTLFFMGSEKIADRVKLLSDKMAFFEHPELFLQNTDLLLLPLFLTAVYVFVMPRVSNFVATVINPTEIKRHDSSVDLDINKVNKQKNLKHIHNI